jgi:hypothetical protein
MATHRTPITMTLDEHTLLVDFEIEASDYPSEPIEIPNPGELPKELVGAYLIG